MRDSNALLDQAKKAQAIPSERQLARRLGISDSLLRHYRTGRSALGEDAAIRVSELLDEPAGLVLVELQADRCRRGKHSQAAKAWRDVFKRVSVSAGALVLALVLALEPRPAAAIGVSPDSGGQNNLYYVKLANAVISGCVALGFAVDRLLSLLQ